MERALKIVVPAEIGARIDWHDSRHVLALFSAAQMKSWPRWHRAADQIKKRCDNSPRRLEAMLSSGLMECVAASIETFGDESAKIRAMCGFFMSLVRSSGAFSDVRHRSRMAGVHEMLSGLLKESHGKGTDANIIECIREILLHAGTTYMLEAHEAGATCAAICKFSADPLKVAFMSDLTRSLSACRAVVRIPEVGAFVLKTTLYFMACTRQDDMYQSACDLVVHVLDADLLRAAACAGDEVLEEVRRCLSCETVSTDRATCAVRLLRSLTGMSSFKFSGQPKEQRVPPRNLTLDEGDKWSEKCDESMIHLLLAQMDVHKINFELQSNAYPCLQKILQTSMYISDVTRVRVGERVLDALRLAISVKSNDHVIGTLDCIGQLYVSCDGYLPPEATFEFKNVISFFGRRLRHMKEPVLFLRRHTSSTEPCPVCMENDGAQYETCCGHPIHAHCMRRWRMSVSQDTSESCPVCRHEGLDVFELLHPECIAASMRMPRSAPAQDARRRVLRSTVSRYASLRD